MAELEKVIRGLECCTETDDCNSCPYFEKPEYCSEDVLMRDAIALLKEQEAVKPKVVNADDFLWAHWYVCGSCENPIDPEDKFCRHCGKAVKWDD